MAAKFYSVLFLFFLFLQGCENPSGNEESKPVVEIDSTAYYDSLFRPRFDLIDSFFSAVSRQQRFSGNILFAEKGRIIIKNSYGTTVPEGNEKVRMDHKFQLASVSKPFTAAAVLLLHDEGKLSFADPVSHYIDSFPYEDVTIHHLLCHRGGLGNYIYFCDRLLEIKDQPLTNDSALTMICKYKLDRYYPSDTKFNYSNTGYMILASIVEKVSGESFPEFMRKRIFEPLDMKNSGIIPLHLQEDGDTSRLDGFDYKGRKMERFFPDGAYGDKGMYSTVEDLFKFDRAIKEGRLLKPITWELSFEGKNPDRAEKGKDDYGYGWRIKQSHAGYHVVYHTGWWRGFRSYFIRNLTSDQTIIVLDHYKRGPFLSVEDLLSLADGSFVPVQTEQEFDEEREEVPED